MHHQYRNRWEKQKEAANQSSKEVAASRRLHRTREEGGLGSNDEIPAMYHIPRPRPPGSQVVHLCPTSCAPLAFISTNALIRTLLLHRRCQ